MLELKVKRLVEHAMLPTQATEHSAGLDLYAIDYYHDHEYGFHEYGTGIAVEIPEGHVGLIFPRSSISKTGYALANCVGVIDSDYRGEIKFRFREVEENLPKYEAGDRVGQLIVMPYPQVSLVEAKELSSTDRGTGGFGSSGK